jgi:uncharacterized protein
MPDGSGRALRLDLRQVRAERGATLAVQIHDTIASHIDEVPFVYPVQGTVTLTNLGAVLRVEGRVRTVVTLVCDRCGTPFAHELEAAVEEEAGWGSAADAGSAPEGETSYLVQAGEGIELDVEALARDALVLALPMAAHCSPDCPGLCAGCGANLRLEQCRCQQEPPGPAAIDPRLAPLARWSQGRSSGAAG